MCELFSFLDPSFNQEVLDLTADTRKIKKGSVFFLLPRANTKFIEYFKKSKKSLAFIHSCQEYKDKGVFVDNIEELYFSSLKVFYKESIEKLKVYGITGTNGKTTTAFMFHSFLKLYGVPTGLYGTIHNRFKDNVLKTGLTSPVAEDFYRFNNENFKKGMRAVICEVSSHALDQKRLSTQFLDGASFLSFSQDHLDYHKTMKRYLEAKVKITTQALKKNGFFILSKEVKKLKIWPKEFIKLGEKYNFKILKRSAHGTRFIFLKEGNALEGEIPLLGDYNISNFSMALAMLCEHFGKDFFPDERVFKDFVQIPGRMQRLDISKDSSVFIDYCHTPDSLREALKTLKLFLKDKKIISVFGCGGDRDRAKRSLMGNVSKCLADVSIITSDNPREEDPKVIVKDILKGINGKVFVELKRELAIQKALKLGIKEPCYILIAGKGHERTQEIKGVKRHFSDVEEVLKFIKNN